MKDGNTDNLKCRNNKPYSMDADCSCCGDSFQSESEDKECSSCADCMGACSKSAEPQIEPPMVMMETPSTHNMDSMNDCYNFSELENRLFMGSEGQKTLARIITRMRVEGYDEEAWKVIIGLTAFAYKNFNCKNIPISQQLKMLESAPLREITQFVPGDISGLVNNVLNSETIPHGLEKDKKQTMDAYKIMALGITALAFSYATRR